MATVASEQSPAAPTRMRGDVPACRPCLTPCAQRILVLDGAMGTMLQGYGLGEAEFRGARFADHPRDLRGANDLLSLTRPDVVARDPRPLPGRRRGHHQHQHLQRHAHLHGRLRPGAVRGGDEPRVRAPGARWPRTPRRPPIPEGRPRWVMGSLGPTNRTASLSPDVNDPGARERRLRGARERLPGGGARTRGGRRGPAGHRDHLRHAQRQGRHLRRGVALGGAGLPTAAHHQRHHHRPLRADALGPDGGRLLEQRAARAAAGRRPQLRPGRPAAAALRPGAGRPRRHVPLALPQRRPAQRLRRVRRGPGGHGRHPRRPGRRRRPQHRGRLLRHGAGAHGCHRRRRARPGAARAAGRRAAHAPGRPGAAGHRAGQPLRQRRRAHQRHRLAALREARPRGALRRGRGGRAPAGRERRPGPGHQHGRGAAGLRGGHDPLRAPAGGRAGHQPRALHDRLLEVVGHRGRPARGPGPADRQLRVAQGGRGRVPAPGPPGAPLRRRGRGHGLRRGGPGRIGRAAPGHRPAGRRPAAPSRPASSPRTSSSTPTSSPSAPASRSTPATRWPSSRPSGASRRSCPGVLTSGGVSNVSFSFRGNDPVREAIHAVFLYHAIAAGLDMAIVNAGALPVLDDLDPDLRERVEDLVLDRRPDATERLLEIADAARSAAAGDRARPRLAGGARARAAHARSRGGHHRLDRRGHRGGAARGGPAAGRHRGAAHGGHGHRRRPLRLRPHVPAPGRQVGPRHEAGRGAPRALHRGRAGRTRGARRAVEGGSASATGRRSAGRIVMATVKGDVHDIGKNIVGVVLGCNDYEVIDLGVMVPWTTHPRDGPGGGGRPHRPLRAHHALARGDARGGHGDGARRAARAAAHRRRHHLARPHGGELEPAYSGPVVHVEDASRAVGVAGALLDPAARDGVRGGAPGRVRGGAARARGAHRAGAPRQPGRGPRPAAWPSTGGRTESRPDPALVPGGPGRWPTTPSSTSCDRIDWSPFFATWELRGRYPDILADAAVGAAARDLLDDALAMLRRVARRGTAAGRRGGGLLARRLDPGRRHRALGGRDADRELARLHTLRQQVARSDDRPDLALADLRRARGFGRRPTTWAPSP